VTGVAFSPDGTKVLTGYGDPDFGSGGAIIWDANNGQRLHELTSDDFTFTSVTSVAFSPDGTKVLTGYGDSFFNEGGTKLWDTNTGLEITSFGDTNGDPFWGRFVTSVAFSPDGTQILTASNYNAARILDATTGAPLQTFSGPSIEILTADFSPDSNHILTAGGNNNAARIWDAESGSEVSVFAGHTDIVFTATFSPNGSQILTSSWDDTAKLWDVESGTENKSLIETTDFVESVAFSPDGTQILIGYEEYDPDFFDASGLAKLWDADSGTQIRAFIGHTDPIHAVAFSPDGTQILTGAFDETAILWDTATGDELRTFTGHSDGVSSVAFSPDATQILTGSWDNTALLFPSGLPPVEVDTEPPVITLLGSTSMTIACGEDFLDPGTTVSDNADNGLAENVVVDDNNLNTETPGVYTITYDVADSAGNNAQQVTRTVTVQDTEAPELTLVGGDITLACGEAYTEPGATATDNCDDDATLQITIGGNTVDENTSGVYIITYDIQDSTDNAAKQRSRTVTVEADTTPPVISLFNDTNTVLECGDTFTNPTATATATDNCDGDITDRIEISGDTLDTTTPGTYQRIYTVTDNAGLSTQRGRIITINDECTGTEGEGEGEGEVQPA
jgi:WD40 repeat protein